MIISGDKDFIQLQKYPLVQQWSPITKKSVNGYDPDVYLKEHILKKVIQVMEYLMFYHQITLL